MIYCFSGTGNSLSVARWMAERMNEQVCNITDTQVKAEDISKENCILFVFPIYAWGIPKVVEDFIKTLPNINTQPPTFVVFTCGDDMGMADKVLQAQLQRRGWKLNDAFSVIMRETYICLPGFDIDLREIEEKKRAQANQRALQIADYVIKLCKMPFTQRVAASSFHSDKLTRGSMPWIKSYLVRPLFNMFLMSDRRFHVSKQSCIHCEKCSKTCPLHNISIVDNLPRWNGHCTHCLRCYHVCPNHAIEYGFFTKGKGQVKINF